MGRFLLSDVTVDDMATDGAYECCLLRSCMLCTEGAGLLVCVLRFSISRLLRDRLPNIVRGCKV